MGKYEKFGRAADRCDSPIERLFLTGMLFLAETSFEPSDRVPTIAVDSRGIEFGQQAPQGSRRIDFTLTRMGVDQRFAVELDGYIHHGATPAQFERDAIRQRELAAAGWIVMRFAGIEVIRDPRGCAEKALYEMGRALDGVALDGPPPRPVPTRPVDPELLELQARLERAERAGDWPEQMRLAVEFQRRVRAAVGLV
jgi:very-short-patch-repair endonuclease